MLDYFYTLPQNIKSDHVIINGDEFNHLEHVMRKKVGDRIMVVDGLCIAYEVEITKFDKRAVEGKIIAKHKNHNESELNVTIAVGILKNPAPPDFLVEKVTELGVREIIPLHTERTIPEHAKTERWQKLALAAMKQCGRSFLPTVQPLTSLDELLGTPNKFELKLVFHKDIEQKQNINQLINIPNLKSVVILIGPEGGFSESEIEKAVDHGFKTISLGDRRLRTETAAIAASALILVLS
jgi:16S rRNA (uracil1498-N3)-methyltransferase